MGSKGAVEAVGGREAERDLGGLESRSTGSQACKGNKPLGSMPSLSWPEAASLRGVRWK